MPLKKGSSKEIIQANIEELIAAGHSPEQAAAIAYKEAGSAMDNAHAAGILYRAGDSILLLKRSESAKDYPGHWCTPGGGIDAGENPEQAARRESSEEVGYSPSGAIKKITEFDGFVTFEDSVEKFNATLNDEHTGYVWANPNDLPSPMHPGVLKVLKTGAMDESARKFDDFGWMTIEDNPISKVGVFPYLGSQIGADDKSKIYMVLRPQEELNDPETIESFKLTPFINEHPENLLGNIGSLVKTDNKRVEGVIGEKVYFEFPYLRANLRVYSAQTLDSIEIGKEQVSAGYSCKWSKESGVFDGQAYEYVQRRIRGNHSALVVEGRSGPDVSVMDSMTFKLESKEQQMELKELVESVAALTAQVGKMQGAMDEAAKTAEAKDEEEKKAKEDADKKAMDDAEEEEKAEAERKKAEEDKAKEGAKDEDDDKKDDDKKDEKKDAMDSASFKRAVAAQVAAEVAKQMAKQPAAMDSATIMAEIAKKTDLASRVSHFIGSFAHDSMSLKQVAEYAAEKLGMPKDNAEIRVESYLAGRPSPSQAYGMDSIDVKQSTGAAFLAEHVK